MNARNKIKTGACVAYNIIRGATAREGPRPTSRLLASRPHAETEVDDHPTRMEEEENELVGSLAEKKLPTEGSTGRNGEREKSSG
ncbi:hypothetical protein ANN_05393 [Periplaneta americana]|uniref:Uncharacterized protein n=1 Tax=Periplaneta americana TaxID=6978 RepID=A0ABQ8TCS2_PERAM|nr:hypothetical protein ANN_05393 [Periplaneta americana]